MTDLPKLQIPKKYSPEPIAIVGLGAVMPDANSVEEFWQNIITGRNSIREVPKERWDPKLYYDSDRSVPDKTYSKIGAYVKDFEINPIEYRIPPNVLEQIDLVQQWALASAKEALEDANYEDEKFPRERCAVIVGNSLGGEKSFEVAQRVYFPALVKSLKSTKNFQKLSEKEQNELLYDLEQRYKKKIPEINEDSMPGELPNIVAGRIAAVFNLRGKNMISDAACASSLAAIDIAFKGLQTHEFDAAVVGGSDRSMDPPTYVKFSKIGALSPDGSRPFDKDANGFVMGEGAGMMVLKRLSDAQEAGDKIYALITGVGSSSDGKGKGITAPNPIGQELSVRRAYEASGISPNDIQLIECHGTSTTVGDVVEINTLEKVYKEANVEPKSVRIGSIKSQIGHLKSAAGAAGLLKTALAIHNKVYPPSINFENPNPNLDWESSPFIVNTHPQKWEVPNNTPRIAAVSSFGFGGTNFHVIMEEYDPSRNYDTVSEIYGTVSEPATSKLSWPQYINRNEELLPEPVLLSASSEDKLYEKLSNLPSKIPSVMINSDEFGVTYLEFLQTLRFDASENYRVGFVVEDLNKISKTIDLVKGANQDPNKRSIAQAKGIFVSKGMPTGKLGFVFPGQGSQYADMLFDLSQKYQVVKSTFDEADKILADFLEKPLSEYIWTKGTDPEKIEKQLKQTEITQPAVLTADIAMFRLLKEYGITPEIVAGHSLGEYAALVASEVLSFEDALRAVAIRGKSMAEVDAEDKGTMASISGNFEVIEEILETIDEYVIAANKNSVSSTVISGSTKGVKNAMKAFEKKGMTAIQLSVSAAFHTRIVEPATDQLSEFLDEIVFNQPKIPITSNVSGILFPENPEEIRELMKKQVGAPVEWIEQIRTMHNQGTTKFFEVGPKRALTTFVNQILEKENIVSVACNHPKKGGIRTFNESQAVLFSLGYDLKIPNPKSSILHSKFRWPQYQLKKPVQEFTSKQKTSSKTVEISEDGQQIEILVDKTMDYLQSEAGKTRKMGLNLDRIVVTGVGIGLPGQHKEVFSEDNFQRILEGENFIDKLPDYKLDAQLDKNIRRLIKKSSGEAEFHSPKSYDEVIRLAGQQGKFDLVDEYKVDEGIANTFDIATQLAVASGLEALKDAGIPLVKEYRKTKTGSFLPGGWVLPLELQEETGVIFASAFPGYDNFAKEITNFNEHRFKEKSREMLTELYGEISRRVSGQTKDYLLGKIDKELIELDKTIEEYTFNRKLLLNVLSMGHSQFAQLIKAKGPNTQVNAACASTTQAIGVANDWIRSGRCKRVIIISADNVTTDNLFEWLGSGFLASGAASIKENVEEAALPFDRRRGGMIIGMGAAGLLVETEEEALRRGVVPIVEVMGTHYANSAYHGTRLDVKHVSNELQSFMNRIQVAHGISPMEIGKSLMFMSHETYTPRRGGSAAAEIRSLKETFGDVSSEIHIANTKGFTGHAMGAGIEDAVAIKSVEKGKIPPIANFKQPDPDLGNLKLSSGETVSVEYALRLAAGFGSQIAFVLYKRRSHGNRFGINYEEWLKSIGGSKEDLYKEGKTLRLKDNGVPAESQTKIRETRRTSITPKPAQKSIKVPPRQISKRSSTVVEKDKNTVIKVIQNVLATKTGYDKSLLDPKLDFEEELGIDTIKQAEVFTELRKEFGIEREEEGLNIADYPTIERLADYFVVRMDQVPETISVDTVGKSGEDVDQDKIVEKIQDLIAQKTGYPKDMLDPRLDFEDSLGIDTIKQAEIFSELREELAIERDESLNIADYPTIEALAGYFAEKIAEGAFVTDEEIDESNDTFEKIAGVVSDLTGYPTVMITDEQINFERDLGIDQETKSEIDVKVAELFEIPKNSLEETVNIEEMIKVIKNQQSFEKGIDKAIILDQKKTREKKPVKTSSTDLDLKNNIKTIISSKTGYPEAMLDDSLDLMNDLGIDEAIKEEIINEIDSKYHSDVSALKDAVTLGEILEIVVNKDKKPETKPKKEDDEVVGKLDESISELDREQIKDEIIEIISEKTGYPPELLDDLDADLEAELGIDTVKQAEIFGMARKKYGIPPIEGMLISEYNTIHKITDLIIEKVGTAPQEAVEEFAPEDEIEKEVQDTPATHRYVIRYNSEKAENDFAGKGMVIGGSKSHYSKVMEALDLLRKPSIRTEFDIEPNSTLVFINPRPREVIDISSLFVFLKKKINNITELVLAVSNRGSKEPSIHEMTPLQGAIGGMFKALSMEFSEITSKIVIYEKVEQLIQELGNPGREVVYNNDTRYVVAMSEENLEPVDWNLPKNSVLLASGGAQGITFEIIKSILPNNSTAILLGRTEMREDAPEIANMDEKTLEQKKWQLMSDMKEKLDKVTPVILEKEWSKVTKSAKVYKAIQTLEKLGVNVIYESLDVRYQKEVSSAFDNIKEKLGSKEITHFIHGAGVEISRATKSKKVDEFNLVFDVKSKGFDNLLTEIKSDKLQKVVAFSSIAGRFGNAAQVDYSAANEYLAKRCAELNEQNIDANTIDWSAWAEVGMATRGSTMQVLESQGITPIPLIEGIERFKQEMAQGKETEVVISGELGKLATKIDWYEPDFYRGAMMDNYSGLELKSHRVLSLKKDPYLDDHRIDGKAVLPGVMGLEMMAELTRTIKNESTKSFYNVVFSSPIKLAKNKDLEIIAFANRVGNDLEIDLKSKFIGPNGKQLGDLRKHFHSRLISGKRIPSYPVMDQKLIEDVQNKIIFSMKDIYELFFHGPSYQVLSKINFLTKNTVISSFHSPNKSLFEEEVDLEIDPLFIEAAFQTAGLHLLFLRNLKGLPAGIEAIHLFDNQNEPNLIRAYHKNSTDTHSFYNVEVIDKEGNCIALLDNYQMIHTGSIEAPNVEIHEDRTIDIAKSMAGEISADLVFVEINCLEEVSNAFTKDMLMDSEYTVYTNLKIKKKQLEWLAGRIAAKLAIGKYQNIAPNQIEIKKDENRSPYVVDKGNVIHLSISHSNGIALAVAGDKTVDIEKIEERDPSFVKESFSKNEIEKYQLLQASPSKITQFWTMKEAHLKRMRIGLKTDLHGVEVVSNGRDQSEVESPQGRSIVRSISKDDWVVTIASPSS